MSAQAGFCALGILELYDLDTLNCFLSDAKEACGHLRDGMVVIGFQPLHITALTGAGESIKSSCRTSLCQLCRDADRTEGHATSVPRHINCDLGPPILPLVQVDGSVNFIFC